MVQRPLRHYAYCTHMGSEVAVCLLLPWHPSLAFYTELAFMQELFATFLFTCGFVLSAVGASEEFLMKVHLICNYDYAYLPDFLCQVLYIRLEWFAVKCVNGSWLKSFQKVLKCCCEFDAGEYSKVDHDQYIFKVSNFAVVVAVYGCYINL